MAPCSPPPRSSHAAGGRRPPARCAGGCGACVTPRCWSASTHPLRRRWSRWRPLTRIGYQRLERPFAFVERHVKGALFDCRMCGDCALSSTGMSCPMNCPKGLRNGPCGGVRADGGCEVYPQMPCVWVQAYEGSRRMRGGVKIATPLPPVDQRLKGSSAWLRAARRRLGEAA